MSNPIIHFHGRLVRDPEQKDTMTRFTVAVDKDKKDDGAFFFNCTAWGKTAEFIAKYIKKGTMVIIDGKFNTREYEKDGEKKTSLDVSVDHLDSVKTETKESAPSTPKPEPYPESKVFTKEAKEDSTKFPWEGLS